MTKYNIGRRKFVASAATVSAAIAMGIKPGNILAQEGDILKVRMEADIQVLDPGYMIGGAETTVQFGTMPRLAVPVQDANGTWGWAPSDYVESVQQTDDPLRISFKLKPGFMWSGDYGEVTAEDVKYSFERMTKSDWSGRWPTLDRVDVADKYSGTIVLKESFAPLWLVAISSESGTILCKAAVEKLPEKKFTTEIPAECGPYTLAEWQPKQKAVLKSNPNWQGTKPAFSEVHIIDVEENKAAELAFEAGEIHGTNVTPDTAARYKQSPLPDSTIFEVAGPLSTWMGMNCEHEKLKDIRVRKAIQRAVDVDSILQAAYAGVSPKANGVVPIGILGARPASGYKYDPDEARALLAEAGVTDLSLELKTLNLQDRLVASQIIQTNLADVGIKVEIIPLDSGPFWNLGLESQGEEWKTLQLWIMRYRTSPDPADMIQWFVKSQVGIWNWERWSDPEFEDLWTKGLTEQDMAKRAEGYVRMQEIMEDTGAYLWITHEPVNYIHKNSIKPAFDAGAELLVERFTKA
ncbi:MAG: ABC transporter substrate-binding protein [Dongiaceae bacterium]